MGDGSRRRQEAEFAECPLLLQEDDVDPNQSLLTDAINPSGQTGGSLWTKGKGETDIVAEDGVVV
jgi:hypothetical protein